MASWLLNCIEERISTLDSRLLHDASFLFGSFADGPGLILFMDGRDEIPSASLPEALRAIARTNEGLRLRSNRTSVLERRVPSCYPNCHATSLVLLIQRAVLSLFRRQTYLLSYRDGRLVETGFREASRIFTELQTQPTFFEMCTNPLILSMYVAHDEQMRGEGNSLVRLPDTRPEFYQKIVAELLLYRRDDQSGRKTPMGTQTRKLREDLLGAISLEHVLNTHQTLNAIPWSLAVRTVRKLRNLETDDEAEQFLRRLSVDTGIFVESRQAELQFMHLSLCEYLAAREALRMLRKTLPLIIERITEALPPGSPTSARRLWEVAVFALALAAREQREDAIVELEKRSCAPELVLRIIRESQAYDLIAQVPALNNLCDG